MSTQVQSVQQQVIQLISRVQSEDIRRIRESREINRHKITMHVVVRRFDATDEIHAVSRDLSSMGIGLISSQPVTVDEVCELELELDSATCKLVANCRYCEPFGKGYYISGWRFDNVSS